MDVFGDVLRFHGSLPWQSESRVRVMGHPVYLVFVERPAIVPLPVVAIVSRGSVRRIDTVLSLGVILVDVATTVIQVALRIRWISGDIETGRRVVTFGVDTIPQRILLC